MTTLTATRKIACLDATGHGRIDHQPLPALKPGCLRVQVTATTISPGTQLGGVRAMRQQDSSAAPSALRALGYQAAGVVAEVGQGVARFEVGQRVACFGGGALHADQIIVPQGLCAAIPDGVSDEEASAMNLVLTAIQALRRTPVLFGESLLVVGLGLVGQLTAQVGRIAGLSVMGWDLSPCRLEVARRHGVDVAMDPRQDDLAARCEAFTHGLGFDAAVMALGGDGSAALEQVKAVMKVSPDGHAMGHVTLVGGLTTTSRWGAGMGNLDLHSSARSGPGYHDPQWELGLVDYPPVFVRWTTRTNMELALRLIAQGKLAISPLLTHRLPLDAIDQAIDLLVDEPDKTLGVVLLPEG